MSMNYVSESPNGMRRWALATNIEALRADIQHVEAGGDSFHYPDATDGRAVHVKLNRELTQLIAEFHSLEQIS